MSSASAERRPRIRPPQNSGAKESLRRPECGLDHGWVVHPNATPAASLLRVRCVCGPQRVADAGKAVIRRYIAGRSPAPGSGGAGQTGRVIVTQSKQDHRVRSAPAADTVGDDHPAREIPKRTIGESTLAWLRLRWPRLALIIGCVLAVLSGLVIAGRFAVDQATGTVHQLTINTNGNDSVVQGTPVNGELNILLVGLDNGQAVGGELRTDAAHSDSMMILHVSAAHDQGYLISLPRDLWVAIPGHGSGKLNAAFTFGSA